MGAKKIALNKVLVVYKKSSFALYKSQGRQARVDRMIQNKDKKVDFLISGHEHHSQSLKRVEEVLKKRNIQYKMLYRAHHFDEQTYDLVLSVGGDGTFMEAAHRLKQVPILGINSNPKGSVGFYCGIKAHQLNKALDDFQCGKLNPVYLNRLDVCVDGKTIGRPVLNDLLIAHSNPAATSRLQLFYQSKSLALKCSGIWISTASGSTGAFRSAGGKVLPLESKSVGVWVREPYLLPKMKGLKLPMVLKTLSNFSMISGMRMGSIYIDGAHHTVPFPLAALCKLKYHAYPLKVLKYNLLRRKAFEH